MWRLGLLAIVGAAFVAAAACGSDDDAAGAANGVDAGDASVVPDAASPSGDAEDPRCRTQPVMLTTHPHASLQATSTGQDLIDVRGWRGRVYFAYGDLDKNTGPIVVSSFEPGAKSWQDHLTFNTERIERFHIIGDSLWAPAADPRGVEDPEYAIGTADHVWKEVSIGPSLHVTDAIERVPGEVLLTGSAWVNQAAGMGGGAVWRSVDGGAFERIFPLFDDAGTPTLSDGIFYPFMGAALNGTAYVANVGPAWSFDGGTWADGTPLNDFSRPVNFAGRLVFAATSELWSFDGTARKRLDIRLLDTPAIYQFLIEPLPLFESTEGHLVAVDSSGRVLMTTDLSTWTCIGRAPADVRSIGSLGGVMYFGAAGGRVYAYEHPSW